MKERRETGLEWNYLPLPDNFCEVYTRVMKPYFDEEKAFMDAQEDKGTGRIIVCFDPKTGNCGYIVEKKNDEPTGSEMCRAIGFTGDPDAVLCSKTFVKANSREDRKFGIRRMYVTSETVGDMFVLRVYMFYTKNFKNYGRPETLKEIFRAVMCDGDMWQENEKGISEIPWRSYIRCLKGASWYNTERGAKMDRIHGLKSNYDDYFVHPLDILLGYKSMPNGDRIFARVPDDVRSDLAAEHEGLYQIPGYLCIALRGEKYRMEAKYAFVGPDERVYIGEKDVYFFQRNPWTGKFVSVTCRKYMQSNRINVNAIGLESVIRFDELTGMAGLAIDVLKKQRDAFDFPRVMDCASKNLAAEQMLKCGWYVAVKELCNKGTDLSRGNMLEVLGIPSFVPKMYAEDLCFEGAGFELLAPGLVETREARKDLFKRAAESGREIDRKMFYIAYKRCLDPLIAVCDRYVRAGKNVNSLLKALIDREREGMSLTHYARGLLGKLSDYMNMHLTASIVAKKPYPEFIKPSAIEYWHELVVRDYYRALELAELKKHPKTMRSFTERVTSKSYKGLEYKTEDFSILAPERPDDLIVEGCELDHCVGSYVDMVADGSSMIFFIRRAENISEPYCTAEVIDCYGELELNQCYNAHDTHDKDPKRIAFVEEWCRQKNIRIACGY